MSALGFIGRTKTFALEVDKPVMVASSNLYRKGVVLANHTSTPAYVAIGLAPAEKDFFMLGAYQELMLDTMIPVGPVWARGTGRLVVIDTMDSATPFDPMTMFTTGRKGYWLDIHDPETLFEDVAGTIPAKVDGPVRLIKDKSGNGHDFKQLPAFSPAILRRREYHTFLEFTGVNAYSCNDKFPWLSDPYLDTNGGILAAAVIPKGKDDAWSPIIGNNGGSGNNIGFYISQERRIQHSRAGGAFRTYVNSDSYLAPEGTMENDQPVVVSMLCNRDAPNRITVRADINGRISGSKNTGYRTPQPNLSNVTLGVSSDSYTIGSASFSGEFHGSMCVDAPTPEEREKIHLYLGADVGATIYGA